MAKYILWKTLEILSLYNGPERLKKPKLPNCSKIDYYYLYDPKIELTSLFCPFFLHISFTPKSQTHVTVQCKNKMSMEVSEARGWKKAASWLDPPTMGSNLFKRNPDWGGGALIGGLCFRTIFGRCFTFAKYFKQFPFMMLICRSTKLLSAPSERSQTIAQLDTSTPIVAFFNGALTERLILKKTGK